KWLASFAVTAAVVVTVIVESQKPVSAEFLSIKTIENEIIYRVNVEDPDGRIAEDSLFLEVKGSREKYSAPLEVGDNVGSQIVFGSIGFYDLSVSANLGFGRETLTSEKVEITGSLAGIILDVELDPETVLEEAPEALTYFVSTKYFDPNQEFESVLLEYAYIYDSETPMPERYDPNELY
ncbi:MAG: hypothetical protein WCX85_00325, partial [Bacilli bacterium]